MKANPDFKDLLELLNKEKVRFLLVGAYAVMHYTQPRYTKDLDIWIAIDPENAQKTYGALKSFGAPTQGLTVADLTNPKLVYQIGVEPNRIDILMGIDGVDFQQAWEKKVATTYGDQPIYLLSLEDLIQSKLAAGRGKDLLDIEELNKAKKYRSSKK